MKKYILVQWPECQELMDHIRFNECILVEDNAYMCPEDLYEKVFKTDNIENIRIGNIAFEKSEYLGNEPEFPTWYIYKYHPNDLYGKEDKFDKDGDYYISKGDIKVSYHKNLFKRKELKYTLATFIRDKDGCYELSFIGDRPIELNKEDLNDFWKITKYGYKSLNND